MHRTSYLSRDANGKISWIFTTAWRRKLLRTGRHSSSRKNFGKMLRLHFAVLREDLEQAKPDVLIVVANDQFVNFFWNNIPTFFVTIGDEVKGQFTRHSFHYRNHKELGKAIIRAGMDRGHRFFVRRAHRVAAYAERAALFLAARSEDSYSSDLCEHVGRSGAVATALLSSRRVDSRGGGEVQERVAILATGGLSHFPGSPRIGEIDENFRSPTPRGDAPRQGQKAGRIIPFKSFYKRAIPSFSIGWS